MDPTRLGYRWAMLSAATSRRFARCRAVMSKAGNAPRSIWASIQGDPVFMRRVNGWLTLFWIAMIPVAIELGWLHSVTFVSALSIWALVAGHWSTWQAARVEVTQQQEAEQREKNPIEDRVAEKLVRTTDIEPNPN